MQINSDLTRNRAEEYGFDLWNEFVIPPYYPQLELMKSEKPQIIEGGRGSGKTMLIRYLCHATQFSPKRKNISAKDYRRIGIYWKMDVQFSKLMSMRGAEESLWLDAFINMGVLVLTKEIIDSLYNIRKTNIDADHDINNIDFSTLKDFDPAIPIQLDLLQPYINSQYNKFQSWVSNYKKIEKPIFYPKYFLDCIITIIKEQVAILKDSFYSVYIDEYENLISTHKRIINTWVKHSQSPIIFNIAMKHNSLDVTETLSEEHIVEIHDYRLIDIERLLKEYFSVFASEIFLLKVHNHLVKIFDSTDYLFDTSQEGLSKRLTKEYTNLIYDKISNIFPKISSREIACRMVSDEKIRNKISVLIENDLNSLGQSQYMQQCMDAICAPEAFVILHALFSRSAVDVPYIIKQLDAYIQGAESKFKEWIHNNLVGCILNIYGKMNRLCPLYSGYDTFVTMSKDNIRHFLELCYTSLSHSENFEKQSVDIKDQMTAVKYVSDNMLNEIKQLGASGNILYLFAYRLGNLFEEFRKKDSQSEPEQNQFSIKGELNSESSIILNELVKWSVLYKSKLTKQKDLESGSEYQFNPIYSAYFTISYRKKRRIEISANDFYTLCFGADDEYYKLIKRITSKGVNGKNTNSLSLFD